MFNFIDIRTFIKVGNLKTNLRKEKVKIPHWSQIKVGMFELEFVNLETGEIWAEDRLRISKAFKEMSDLSLALVKRRIDGKSIKKRDGKRRF